MTGTTLLSLWFTRSSWYPLGFTRIGVDTQEVEANDRFAVSNLPTRPGNGNL